VLLPLRLRLRSSSWRLHAESWRNKVRARRSEADGTLSSDAGWHQAKAQFRAQSRGIDLDGPSLTREALGIYRKERSSGTEAPVLEGASRADGNSMPSKQAEKPVGKSHFEEYYGASPGDELHEEKPDFEKMTQDYADTNRHCNRDCNTQAHSITKGRSLAEASSNSATAPLAVLRQAEQKSKEVVRNLFWLLSQAPRKMTT
jgi:hypothetical protein